MLFFLLACAAEPPPPPPVVVENVPPAPEPEPGLDASAPDPAAGPAIAALPVPTRARAGGKCVIEAPSDVATSERDPYRMLQQLPSALGFGAVGGIVRWEEEDDRAFARPIGMDGRPTGDAVSFATPGSYLVRKALPFSAGFAVIASTFDGKTLDESYWVQLLSPTGAALGAAQPLAIGEQFYEDASDMVGDRFLVLGGPNQGKGKQGARVLLVRANADGTIIQKKLEYPQIQAPVAVRPAVSFALGLEHWAVGVQVRAGGAQAFQMGGQTYETKPLVQNTSGVGASRSIIIDGKLSPITGEDPGDYGMGLGAAGVYALAWAEDGLAVAWSRAGGTRQFARMGVGGALVPARAGDAKLAALVEDPVLLDFSSGPDGTRLYRRGVEGEVGDEVDLLAGLPNHTPLANLQTAWTGDRWVMAYAQPAGDKTAIRTVGVKCPEAAKKPAKRKPRFEPME